MTARRRWTGWMSPGCPWIADSREALIASLLDGSYQPQPVRGVQIVKPGGRMRRLSIPTVVDRLVQQAIAQTLEPLLDPTIFRHRARLPVPDAAHMTRCDRARNTWPTGMRSSWTWTSRSSSIRVATTFLVIPPGAAHRRQAPAAHHPALLAGRHDDRTVCATNGTTRTRWGGPLSPLLANLLLDDLDKELERRGHRFCRYADDCNIYVRSEAAGERVMASVTAFLEGKLRLKVNQTKSAVAPVGERQFLGHRLGRGGSLGIGRKSLGRAKDRLRETTRRNRGDCPLERMIEQANRFTVGWVTYYRHAQCKSALRDLDGWLRRKLRCVELKRCKLVRTMVRFLIGNGVTRGNALKLASSGKGWWRLTDSQQAKQAMPIAWFDALGLTRLADHHAALNLVGNRRGTRSVRPVV